MKTAWEDEIWSPLPAQSNRNSVMIGQSAKERPVQIRNGVEYDEGRHHHVAAWPAYGMKRRSELCHLKTGLAGKSSAWRLMFI